MSEKSLVIVESPTKARTIKKFLPSHFMVEASMGHLRDLPQSAAEIPAKLKKENWARLGVNVENDFEPLYVVPKGKSKIVRELKKKVKEAKVLYLATDEDREGESISWHLLNVLAPKIPVKRMVFHEITKKAIRESLENTRDLNLQLVHAQEARRILDRIYGYTLSPLLWKKICFGLSAGRVQSSGLRLIVARERERMEFVKSQYWTLNTDLTTKNPVANLEAQLTFIGEKKIASGKDFEDKTGKLKDPSKHVVIEEKDLEGLKTDLRNATYKVNDVVEKDSNTKPLPPFMTSTLQQEGNRKLSMSAREVMRTAQKLYEEGHITYMRTDSVSLSEEAINASRDAISHKFGKDYLPAEPRRYQSKSKSAQEAHEAIRPAGSPFVEPSDTGLSGSELNLYKLIWARTLASQMKDSHRKSLTAKIEAGKYKLVAHGSRMIFDGFYGVWAPYAAKASTEEVFLPELKVGDHLNFEDVKDSKHETKAPARYTEASLVQNLENAGIGRPSTYTTIISTILDRGYVRKDKNHLIPTFMGMAVVQFLESYFKKLVDYDFTSEMENSLDEIAYGKMDTLNYLKDFYLGHYGLKEQVEKNEKIISPEESRSIQLSHLKKIQVKVGRFGPYVVSKEKTGDAVHASIPEEIAPADLKLQDVEELIEQNKNGPTPLGVDPETKMNVYCLIGRYGAYLQLGETEKDGPKPKRVTLPKGYTPSTVTFEDALKFLSLPRELGNHPDSGKMISVNNGRFGPYVLHDGEFRSLKKDDDVYTIEFDRALEILKEEKKTRRGPQLLRDMGMHPKRKKKIGLYMGRYGAYLKLGTRNIALPPEYKNDDNHTKLTPEKAVEIVDLAFKTKR